MEIVTSHGPARADLTGPAGADLVRADLAGRAASPFLLVLTHGAGGTVNSADLLAARAAALGLGGTVALVTQPYRVRGARAPGSAERQDESWREIIAWLRANVDATAPLIQGGRSNGARVACRTAAAAGARGVLALAFPLRPPGRRPASRPRDPAGTARAVTANTVTAKTVTPKTAAPKTAAAGTPATRAGELRAALDAGASVLVVNGDRDPFGIPDPGDATEVVVLKGETHSLSRNPAAVSEAVADWLSGLVRLAR
jgi:uncharacterized protein